MDFTYQVEALQQLAKKYRYIPIKVLSTIPAETIMKKIEQTTSNFKQSNDNAMKIYGKFATLPITVKNYFFDVPRIKRVTEFTRFYLTKIL